MFKLVLTLSHGQASVERGFSVNKDVISANMLERTIIAQRMICNAVDNLCDDGNNGDVSKITITKEMLKCCNGARMKYEMYLNEIKMSAKVNNIENEKEKLKEEINSEKKMQVKWNNICERLRKEADDLATKAEKEKKMSLLIDSNETRKRSLEYKEYVEASLAKVQKLGDKLKTIT